MQYEHMHRLRGIFLSLQLRHIVGWERDTVTRRLGQRSIDRSLWSRIGLSSAGDTLALE
jgi:hypothetical protein